MPRLTFSHRDIALAMTGSMPARKPGETDKAFERRKISAATQMEKHYGLTPYVCPGKRARRYRDDQLKAAQQQILPAA